MKIKLKPVEREIVKLAIAEGFEWADRDLNNLVNFCQKKPWKSRGSKFWISSGHEIVANSFLEPLFLFIRWEDEEPINLKELLAYKSNKKKMKSKALEKEIARVAIESGFKWATRSFSNHLYFFKSKPKYQHIWWVEGIGNEEECNSFFEGLFPCIPYSETEPTELEKIARG